MNSKSMAVVPDNALAVGINQQLWDALSASVYPGARPDSIVMVYQYCKVRHLDPLKKPVHIVPMSVKNALTNKYEWRDVIMPGIQELRTTASRTNLMAGVDPPKFGPVVEVPVTDAPDVKDPLMVSAPEWCEITVYRLDANGVPRAYTHVEFFLEAVARTREGAINSMWQRRSRGQLIKCAEAGALRKAFPEELGGIYSADEMIGKVIGGNGEDVIDGDFATVTPTGAVTMPDEITPEATPEPAAKATPQPEATPAQGPAKGKYAVKNGTAPAEEKGPEPPKVELDKGPMRVLTSRLQAANLTEAQLLEGFGKTVNIGNINEALTWIKERQG